RGNVDDRAAAGFRDLRHRIAHHQEMAAEVDGEHRVELLGGGLQEIAADGDADVVDEQMERGERARRGFDGAATLLFDADVGGDRVRAPAFVANCRGGLLRELERAIGDHYGRTFARAHY